MARLGNQNNPGLLTRADGSSWAEIAQERENNEMQMNMLRERMARQEALAAEVAEGRAHEDIHYHQGTGKFISPKYDILAAHQKLVTSPQYELGFSPNNYPSFDAIVAEKAEIPGFADRDHPDYERYAPLRRNVAVVRNAILDHLFADGKFNNDDQEDVIKLEMVPIMAERMGESLKYGKFWLRRPWTVHVNTDDANVEGAGAAELYKGLLAVQNGFSIYNLKGMLPGGQNTDWGLPPIVDSPFSPANMAAQLPEGAYLTSKSGDEPEEIRDSLRAATALMAASITIDSNARRLRNVDTLEKPVLDESVELGREILRKLRVQLGASDQSTGMAQPTGDKAEQAGLIAHLSEQYRDYIAAACCANPAICENPEVIAGNEAMGKLAYIVKRLAADEMNKAGDAAGQRQLASEIAAMPENWKNLKGESFATLLEKVDKGYEYAAKTLAQDPLTYNVATAAHAQHTLEAGKPSEDKKQQEVETANQQIMQEQERILEDLRRRELEKQLAKSLAADGKGMDAAASALKKMGVAQAKFEAPKAPRRADESPPRSRTIAPEEIDVQFEGAESPALRR